MKAGLAQMDIVWENVSENMRKAESFFEEAKAQQVDMLVFPEMSLTGFSMNVEKTTRNWEEQLLFFQRMSRKYSMGVVCGYPEGAGKRENILCRNRLAVIDQGEILMDYAKIHPFSYGEESRYFEGGDRILTACWRDTVLGGFVCYDLRFPELFITSSETSEIIFVIANWPAKRIAHWDVLLRARAIENQCFIIGVNRTGSGGNLLYNGHSAVYSPTGDQLTPLLEQEKLITAGIDLAQVREYRRDFPLKQDRKIKEADYFKSFKY